MCFQTVYLWLDLLFECSILGELCSKPLCSNLCSKPRIRRQRTGPVALHWPLSSHFGSWLLSCADLEIRSTDRHRALER